MSAIDFETMERLTEQLARVDRQLAEERKLREAAELAEYKRTCIHHNDGERATILHFCPVCEHVKRESAEKAMAESIQLKPIVEALTPFAACEPTRFRSVHPHETWLWKPSRTSNPNEPGIAVAHIDAAKAALQLLKALGLL